MEHRWGERVAVCLSVELSCGSSQTVAGAMENVSSSGAFVRTAGRGPPRGPVEVIFAQPGSWRGRSVRLPAYVVRETADGVGIEWCEFAPRAVRELMVRDRRGGGTGASARAAGRRAARGRAPRGGGRPARDAASSPPALTGTGARVRGRRRYRAQLKHPERPSWTTRPPRPKPSSCRSRPTRSAKA